MSGREETERRESEAVKPKLPDDVRTAMESLVEYLWHDERRHYEETAPAYRERHIFASLVTLRNWLDGESRPIEWWLADG